MASELIHGGGVLGEKITQPRRVLDRIDLPKPVEVVKYTSDEVTSNCPITGQPDWYEVQIRLHNSDYGIESKSLKLYLQSFRDDGMFCEAFAAKIADDVSDAIDARGDVSVSVVQKPRGGVSIDARAYRGQRYNGAQTTLNTEPKAT